MPVAPLVNAVNRYPFRSSVTNFSLRLSWMSVKEAASMANRDRGALGGDLADAIVTACDRILRDDAMRMHFVVDVFQAGAGTSFNMNCNEVIANLANVSLDHALGEYKPV